MSVCATTPRVIIVCLIFVRVSGLANIDILQVGQSRVNKLFIPPRSSSFSSLQFCANRLVSLDTKNELIVWDLDTGKRITGYHAPGLVVSMVTDPVLDWCFLGLQTGDVYAYDLDRQRLSPFRLTNFWAQRDPKARAVSLVSMQLHPRDIGKLLIGYSHGVVIYSFKHNQATQFFEYQVPPGAPGGSGHSVDSPRKPRVTHAVWHPTGTFILTAHDDGSLVFWDAKDSRVVMARTLYDSKVDQPVPHTGPSSPKHRYLKLAWCCKQNPDDTGLLIAGGQSLNGPASGLTFIELGITPNYATSSWQILAEYCKGKKQNTLDTPPSAEVTDFFLVPRASPHFAGAQDPIAVLTLLSSGELITLSFPSGYHISPTNQLHPSLSFVHPFAIKFAVTIMDRPMWLGMVENRNQGDSIVKGGAEAPRPRRRFEGRTVIQVAHADSTIRIWDVGHGDDIENPAQLQVDIARSLDRTEDVTVTTMSMAPTTGELVVGTSGGEVVIYRWGANKFYGENPNTKLDPNPGGLTDISKRAEPSLKSGLQPFSLYEMMQGPITVVKASDVGFMAVGSEGGFLSIIDMRGPLVMYQASMVDFEKKDKRSSFLKGHSHAAGKEWPVAIEFGVMTVDDDKYSSICCFVGTNMGKLITFKLLPSGAGYNAQVAGVASLGDKIVAICPIIADTGKPAYATGPIVAGLREGKNVNGLLVVGKLNPSFYNPYALHLASQIGRVKILTQAYSNTIGSAHLQAGDGQGGVEVVRRLPVRRGVRHRVPAERYGVGGGVRGPGGAGLLAARAEGDRERAAADDGREPRRRHGGHGRRRPVLLGGAVRGRRPRRLGHRPRSREHGRHARQPQPRRPAPPHHIQHPVDLGHAVRHAYGPRPPDRRARPAAQQAHRGHRTRCCHWRPVVLAWWQ